MANNNAPNQGNAPAPGPAPIFRLPTEIMNRIAGEARLMDQHAVWNLRRVSRDIAFTTHITYISTYFTHRAAFLDSKASILKEIQVAQDPYFGPKIKYLSLFTGWPSFVGWNFNTTELYDLFVALRPHENNFTLIITTIGCEFPQTNLSEDKDLGMYWDPYNFFRTSTYNTLRVPLTVIQQELERSRLRVRNFAEQRGTGAPAFPNDHFLTQGATQLANWQRTLPSVESFSIRTRMAGQGMLDGAVGRQWRPSLDMLTQLPNLQTLSLARGSFRRSIAPVDNGHPNFPRLKKLRLESWYIGTEDLVSFINDQPFLVEIDLFKTQWAIGFGASIARTAQAGEDLETYLKRLTRIEKVTADKLSADWINSLIRQRVG